MVTSYGILLCFSGKRDIVGFGETGEPAYFDLQDQPCPAVRFGKNTAEIMALKEKEKGDWKNLTLEERKQCKLTCVTPQP